MEMFAQNSVKFDNFVHLKKIKNGLHQKFLVAVLLENILPALELIFLVYSQ